jgi:hypothetical protein
MNEYKYPTSYELKEILSRITNRKFLNEFAQKRSIFITNASQELVADQLAKLFYDDQDLELIRKEAYKENHSHTLSGFTVKSLQKNFNLKNEYERLRENAKFDLGVILNEVSKVSEDETFDYKSSYEYTKTKPGRIEFLQNETNSFDFYFTDLGKNLWQIEVDANTSSDTKELKNFFLNNLQLDTHTVQLIDQSYLNSKATIEFFDKLAKEGLATEEWNFLDVKHLTVRRGNDKEEDEEYNESGNEDDENEKEASEQELTGITQAILEGKNLREDAFVKDCEKRGYRFTAMTYEFEEINNPSIITIKAEFKGRPKVFEVGITEVHERTGITMTKQITHLSAKANRRIRSMFWNNAKRIYFSMKSSK